MCYNHSMVTVLSIAVPLFFLMDYIGTIPVFLTLTKQYSQKEKLHAAVWSSLLACAIVLGFAILGQYIMEYFGLSIAALKVGGGIMLLYIALEMIFSGQLGYEHADARNIIVSPLAIPMLAGPGCMSYAMVTFITLPDEQKWLIVPAMAGIYVVGTVLLIGSAFLNRMLGKEFVRGLEKVTAVFLAIIAAEMVMQGIKLFFF